MGILDPKERVFDIVLTDKGRELLSKNQLNFVYYAFSDEGVDYSGSLNAVATANAGLTASVLEIDDHIHRNLAFEAGQRKDKNLSSFLYTVPDRTNVLPEFKISVNTSSSIELERRFRIDTVVLSRRPVATVEKPIDIVVRASVPKKTYKDRVKEYVDLQKLKTIMRLLGLGNK